VVCIGARDLGLLAIGCRGILRYFGIGLGGVGFATRLRGIGLRGVRFTLRDLHVASSGVDLLHDRIGIGLRACRLVARDLRVLAGGVGVGLRLRRECMRGFGLALRLLRILLRLRDDIGLLRGSRAHRERFGANSLGVALGRFCLGLRELGLAECLLLDRRCLAQCRLARRLARK